MRSALMLCAAVMLAGGALGADLGPVQDRSLELRDVRLASGAVMPELRIAYETYGTLAPDGRNGPGNGTRTRSSTSAAPCSATTP